MKRIDRGEKHYRQIVSWWSGGQRVKEPHLRLRWMKHKKYFRVEATCDKSVILDQHKKY